MHRSHASFTYASWATEPEDFLAVYAKMARQADPAFDGFSAERGRAFYFRTHKLEDGSELSCASCHHADPRKSTAAHIDQIPCRACHVTLHKGAEGRSAIKREIKPETAILTGKIKISGDLMLAMQLSKLFKK